MRWNLTGDYPPDNEPVEIEPPVGGGGALFLVTVVVVRDMVK